MKNKRNLAAFVVVSLLFTTLVSFVTPNERYFEITKNLDIFSTLYREVNAHYVDEVNPANMIKTGIDAMLQSLDPYTNYIPEDEIEDYRTMTTGQYGGIGALIGRSNGKNMILMPYEGFPAYKAGLKIGDEILKVDGIDVAEKNTSEISQLLKGQAKTSFTITVRRINKPEAIDLQITREKITIDNVPYSGMLNDDIGYIKLSDFTNNAGKEVASALEALKKQGAKKLIFDLRDNPGGLLFEAVNVSNVFVPKGVEVVSTKGKVKEANKTYKTLNDPTDTDIPMAVLTSRRSASAAEIVAGVIQDYDRGILVGERTFGKGLVQATRPLTYNSQLKVTTAKYYIPSGRCIQAINYSHRNEDGSVGKVPDSLRVEFKTKNGRSVYDGGGINPDSAVDRSNLAPISASLITKGLIFDYATEYYYSNDSVLSAKDFKITDEVFNDFVSWLSDKDYDYVTSVEKTIEELTEYAKAEKYYENIKGQIDELKAEVKHNKVQDLYQFKGEIESLLEEEIVSRYYLRRGQTEASFAHDPQLQKAMELLNAAETYNQLLATTKE